MADAPSVRATAARHLTLFLPRSGGCRLIAPIWVQVLALLFLWPVAVVAQPTGADLEYEVKAAFLYNFLKFVEWPPNEFAAPDSPVRVGLLGDDPFDGEFEEAVRDRKAWNHPIVVEEVDSLAEAADVHLLFVVAGEEKRLKNKLAELHAAGVLTVGETPDFRELGGIITFTLEGGRVRFFINRQAAAETGIQIRAQLLQLALSEPR